MDVTTKLITSQLSHKLLKDKKVLVTGGAGFLGSWLCETLIWLGARVTCLDNLSTGKIENIKHLGTFENFSFVKADVAEFCPDGFDYIIHGASLPSPDDYMRRPVEAMLPNSLGLLKCLENARKDHSVLLYLSTSEVYGDAEVIPTPEAYWGKVNPISLRSCYDESKRFGEALCMAYFRQYNVDVRIARIFNTFGPRLDINVEYARVIPKFIIQALRYEPITVHGDGKQTRSFCYVSDMVVGLLKFMICEECRGEVMNFGNPHEITILELAHLIKKLTNSQSEIIFLHSRPDDPRRRSPDISKARKLLNWEPKVSLNNGLSYTIEWFKEMMKR
ncbi:MAG: UDP-glucuronic acid decarboxylase family protein [Thermoprotei archaeon]